jgi:hypothetical protein
MDTWVNALDQEPNRLKDYVLATNHTLRLFFANEFEDGPYQQCKNCKASKCYLMTRIRKSGKMCNQLSPERAQRMNIRLKQIYT